MKPSPKIRRHKELGPLHDLLLRACPPDPKTGIKSITRLADLLGLTSWCCYKWIRNNHIPPAQAKLVMSVWDKWATRQTVYPVDRVSLRDFDPYVFN